MTLNIAVTWKTKSNAFKCLSEWHFGVFYKVGNGSQSTTESMAEYLPLIFEHWPSFIALFFSSHSFTNSLCFLPPPFSRVSTGTKCLGFAWNHPGWMSSTICHGYWYARCPQRSNRPQGVHCVKLSRKGWESYQTRTSQRHFAGTELLQFNSALLKIEIYLVLQLLMCFKFFFLL